MDLKDLAKKLEQMLGNVDKDTFEEIGKTQKNNIEKRTRLGFGVKETGGRQEKLKPLSPGYVKGRKGLKRKGNLSPKTTPARSNLTKTGEMLNSLKVDSSNSEVRIYIDGKENVKKAQDQVKAGREFMNLTKSDIKDLVDVIVNKIIKGL